MLTLTLLAGVPGEIGGEIHLLRIPKPGNFCLSNTVLVNFLGSPLKKDDHFQGQFNFIQTISLHSICFMVFYEYLHILNDLHLLENRSPKGPMTGCHLLEGSFLIRSFFGISERNNYK